MEVARLILGSGSARRRELLREAGYEFIVQAARIDEQGYDAKLLPVEVASLLAEGKVRSVARDFPGDVVLAADTVVAFGDQVLGKPADAHQARQMLELLSGTTQIVITAVAVLHSVRQFSRSGVAMSAVRMRKLSRLQIEDYIESKQWEGKAGGYGVQDADPFVTCIAGSRTNVVGLPMEITTELLGEAGIRPRGAGG